MANFKDTKIPLSTIHTFCCALSLHRSDDNDCVDVIKGELTIFKGNNNMTSTHLFSSSRACMLNIFKFFMAMFVIDRCVLLLALVVVLASVDFVSADGDILHGKVLSEKISYMAFNQGIV